MSSDESQTRIRILESAWKLLEEGQGRGVRMSDIAKAAGVSRQAVYLHYETRAALLIAVTRHVDTVKDVDARLRASRTARTGQERLDAFVTAWAGYIPEIHGVGKALMAMGETDEAAAEAWDDRMQALRQGCAAAVDALKRDGDLSPDHSRKEAIDLLWTLLSVRNWEHLTRDCGWSQKRYVRGMAGLARQTLVISPDARGDHARDA